MNIKERWNFVIGLCMFLFGAFLLVAPESWSPLPSDTKGGAGFVLALVGFHLFFTKAKAEAEIREILGPYWFDDN